MLFFASPTFCGKMQKKSAYLAALFSIGVQIVLDTLPLVQWLGWSNDHWEDLFPMEAQGLTKLLSRITKFIHKLPASFVKMILCSMSRGKGEEGFLTLVPSGLYLMDKPR